MERDLSQLPGGDLVQKGLADLNRGMRTEESLLVMIANPSLRQLGITFRPLEKLGIPFEHELFERLQDRVGKAAHMDYNSLIRLIVSFANAYPRLYRDS